MATVRLTNAIREAIVKSILKHRFADDIRSNIDEEVKLARDLYLDAIGKDKSVMDALPPHFFDVSRSIKVAVGYSRRQFEFGGSWYKNQFKECNCMPVGGTAEQKRVPYSMRQGSVAKQYDEDSKLGKRISEHDDATKKLSNDIDRAKREAMAIVESASTIKRLMEIWPEAEPFIKPFAQESRKSQLPAVQIDKVNAQLGLPVVGGA